MKTESFYQTFRDQIRPVLQKELNYDSPLAVPNIKKLVINIGVKQAVQDKKHVTEAAHELHLITGQKPIITKAKKSIAGFKLREGMPIGVKVTLRKASMYAFIHRLIHIVFPRIRDFRGLSKKALDQKGNYNIGIREQIIFPEIDYDKIRINKGMNLTFVIQNKNKTESLLLLRKLGFPIKK